MRTRIALTAATALLLVTACGTANQGSDPSASPSSANAVSTAPGTLVSQRAWDKPDQALASATGLSTYIRYQSTAPSGKPVEVSGAVFLPQGQAPAGGWPVVAFAHGTSGVVNACAPTNSPNLKGSSETVAQILGQKYAVVMTNYQGLDGPGAAPYVDAASSGYDVLNSVRAARATGLPLSEETGLVGVSQGGRAAQSAAETAKTYAPDIAIHGVVLLSPALEINFSKAIREQTLNKPDQYLILPYLSKAVRYHKPEFSDQDMMRGDLLAAAPRLEEQCTGTVSAEDAALAAKVTPADAQFANAGAEQAVAQFEANTNLPKVATSLPTYIVRGDNDKLINTAWSTHAIGEMCRLGTPVRDLVVPGGHDAPGSVVDRWLKSISDVFADAPLVTTCRV